MKKKATFEVSADYIDWKEMLDKIKEMVDETCREVSSFEINYSESEDD